MVTWKFFTDSCIPSSLFARSDSRHYWADKKTMNTPIWLWYVNFCKGPSNTSSNGRKCKQADSKELLHCFFANNSSLIFSRFSVSLSKTTLCNVTNSARGSTTQLLFSELTHQRLGLSSKKHHMNKPIFWTWLFNVTTVSS